MNRTLAMPRPKSEFERDRFEFRAEPEWIAWAMEGAKASGINNLSAFIRMAVTEYLSEKKIPKPRPKKKSAE